MVHRTERPLTDAERGELEAERTHARARTRTAVLRFGAAAAFVCGGLAILTLLASDAPRLVILGFWTVLALLFTLWLTPAERRQWLARTAALDDALRTNRARVVRIASDRVVEFEEVEDEGACFAFDAGEGRSIFVTGQQFYADDTFPNSDFSIVDVLTSTGAMHELVTRAGRKIEPERVVGADRKKLMTIPDHLEIVETPLGAIGT